MESADFRRGISLLNAGEYFQAHEVLEDVWRAAAAHDKRFFQGLTQLAVALHHYSRGNVDGAKSLLERSRRNLLPYGPVQCGIDVAALCDGIEHAQSALNRGEGIQRFELKVD